MGARNPKVERIMVSAASDVSERLAQVCDKLGHNKGTVASFCMSMGLNVMEQILYASERGIPMQVFVGGQPAGAVNTAEASGETRATDENVSATSSQLESKAA
jgi:hypothetical protein